MRVDRSAQEKKQINFVSQVVCASRRMVRVNNVALSHVPIQELSLNGQIDTQVENLIVWFYFARRLSESQHRYSISRMLREISLDRKYYRHR